MQITTTFKTKERYIFLPVFITTFDGKCREFDAILDTGAPQTEFSDKALCFAGFTLRQKEDVNIQGSLPTQKYSKIILPNVEICSRQISNLEVYVSRFAKDWGVDALVGLDFFKLFKVTIDYKKGVIVTEPY
ncbi:MAG: aspartyl protease family protein [Pseudomonadota bacterium]